MGKLVRDNIPEIMLENGEDPIVKQLEGKEFFQALLDKLDEEHRELRLEININEIVDMMEVLLALSGQLGFSESDTLEALHKKRRERGCFEQGIFLLGKRLEST